MRRFIGAAFPRAVSLRFGENTGSALRRVVLVTGGLLWGASSAAAQPSDYVMRLTSAVAPEGSAVEVGVTLDHNGEVAVAGWSLAVCHDPGLEVIRVVSGGTTLAMTPDLLIEDVQGPGWIAGVVISFFGLEQLAPGVGHDLHHAYYWVPAAGLYALNFCAIGNVDPRINEFLAANSTIPETRSGSIAAMNSTLPRFLRGDCNSNGSIDVVDGMELLSFLYAGGAFPGSCLEACNANGQGSIQPVDALLILNFLFLGGIPPALPFPYCGSVSGVECGSSLCP